MLRPVLIAVVLGTFLSACGHGGARTVLPGVPGGTKSGHAVVPRSSNVDTFNGTLWYGDDRSLRGVALTYGPSAEIDGSYAGLVGPSSRAMTVSRDGTVYELIQNNADGPPGWQLRIYGPGTTGRATPEATLSGIGYSRQVFLVGDGIDVLTTSAPNGGGTATLATFAYGASNDAAPVRTASLGADVLDAATDRYDRIYVARKNGTVTVYPAAATCACSPVRTVTTGALAVKSLAVTDDGTVYVLLDDARAESANVNAYPPGNDGPSPWRTYGPFYDSPEAAPPGLMGGAPTGGIAVDAAGDVYVGLADNGGRVHVDEFNAGEGNGTEAARSIATPSFSTYLTSIAIGPVLSRPLPPATLYVASRQQIRAYPANASGNATPQRVFGSFYYDTPGPPTAGGWPTSSTGSLVGIATGLDGTVTALQSTVSGIGSSSFNPSCTLTVFAADANGSSGVLSQSFCNFYNVAGPARGYAGELEIGGVAYQGSSVIRMLDGAFASMFTVTSTAAAFAGIAADPTGEIFVDETFNDFSGSEIDVYDHLAQNGASPSRSIKSSNLLGPVCAGADGTLYAVSATNAGPNGPTSPYSILAIPPGASTASRTIGPFADPITAISCDAQNRIFAGLLAQNPPATRVEVYAADANGAATPLWTLANPVPAGEPGGQRITSLALSPGAVVTGPQPGVRTGGRRRFEAPRRSPIR